MFFTILYIPEDRIIKAGRKVQIFYPKWMVKEIECRKGKLRKTLLSVRKSKNMIL